jgi:hypothetical protein
MTQQVMLNLVLNSFQYRFSISMKLMNYEILKQAQDDRQALFSSLRIFNLQFEISNLQLT